jgi:hypothetical protein
MVYSNIPIFTSESTCFTLFPDDLERGCDDGNELELLATFLGRKTLLSITKLINHKLIITIPAAKTINVNRNPEKSE